MLVSEERLLDGEATLREVRPLEIGAAINRLRSLEVRPR